MDTKYAQKMVLSANNTRLRILRNYIPLVDSYALTQNRVGLMLISQM